MATGEQILDGVANGLGANLSLIARSVLSARLQQAIDAGTDSSVQLSVVLASNPSISANVPTGSNTLLTISSIVSDTLVAFPTDEPDTPIDEEPVVDDHANQQDDTATALGFMTLSGVLEEAGDVDVFKMTLDPGQYTYSINDLVDGVTSTTPIIADLYLANNVMDAPIFSIAVEDMSFDHTFTVEEAGQYFIEVYHSDANSGFNDNTYTVALEQNEVQPEEPVSNAKTVAHSRSYQVNSVDGLPTSQTQHVNTLLEESSLWDKASLTYGFPSSIPSDHVNSGDSGGWRALTSLEQLAFERVAATQNQYINLDLIKTSSGVSADVRVSAVNQDANTAAYAYYPGSGAGGDVFLDANSQNTEEADYFLNDKYGVLLILHELGHAMGMDHSFEGSPAMPTAVDNSNYTVMTYTQVGMWTTEAQQTGGGGYNFYTVNGFRTDLGIFDVAALQVAYGADLSTNTDNTVYRYDESTRSFDSTNSHYLTIWDADGEDTIDASDAAFASTIDLSDYTLSSISERTTAQEAVLVAQAAGLGANTYDTLENFIVSQGEGAFLNQHNLGIAKGAVIENVITGQGNDTVTDNQVDNSISTGAGNDLIILGNGGFDTVNGGSGNDTVRLSIASTEVETFEDETGYYIAANNFGAQLIGIETIEYTDQTYTV
ncbi:matrixin family metalloprotease [Marinomonas gallaica]|uniref:matrixin family metalloprotease n=1 Tax=Marinomonas gallaica TaxID=1806667 RepID=UPI003CE4EBE1